jgi:mono/diheme cytochrome c family protein
MRRTLVLIAATIAVMLCDRGGHAAPAGGRQLYLRHCAGCHGPSGRGDGPNTAVFAVKPRDLREGFLERYAMDDLVRRVRDGRALELALDVPALRARAREVEALAAYLRSLPRIDWGVVDEGWAIYAGRCESCHGPFGRSPIAFPAGVGPPVDLGDQAFQKSVSNDDLLTAVRHGRKGMPAQTPRLSEGDARALVAFIRVLSPGFQLYSQYCASCHGDTGAGIPSFADRPDLPTVVFDEAYFVRTDPVKLREAIWHMVGENKPSMPHFRPTLSDADARAILEYLKESK